MNLGNTLIELRKQKGIKQNELAKKCDITQAYLSQIENNKKEPNLSTLKTISNVLEIPLPIIFFLSLDKDDVPYRKHEAFETLNPFVRSLISDFFIQPLYKKDQ